MDHPDALLTWTVRSSDLAAGKGRSLKSAVTVAERCLDLWQDFLAAATSQRLHVTVTAALGDGPPTVGSHLDTERGTLHIEVPHSVLDEPAGRLAALIVDIVAAALVTVAERHPHSPPATFWFAAPEESPLDEPGHGIRVEDVLDGEVLLIGRFDGTDAGFDRLEHHLSERLEEPRIAGLGDTDSADSAAYWTLEILDGAE